MRFLNAMSTRSNGTSTQRPRNEAKKGGRRTAGAPKVGHCLVRLPAVVETPRWGVSRRATGTSLRALGVQLVANGDQVEDVDLAIRCGKRGNGDRLLVFSSECRLCTRFSRSISGFRFP